MKPYTITDKEKEKYENKDIADETCHYCGITYRFPGESDYYPYRCRKDTLNRDCEGRCEYYKEKEIDPFDTEGVQAGCLVFVLIFFAIIICVLAN